MKNIFKNIGLKLVLIVGVVSIFTIGMFSYILIQSQKEILLTEVERHASQLSETIRNSTRYDMLLNLRAHLHQIISDIAREPSIMVIRVMNKEGKIIYSSSENEIGQILEKEAESCYACHTTIDPLQDISMPERTRIFHSTDNSIRALGIITPIYNEPSCWQSECHAHNSTQTILGVLDISTSLEKVDEQLSESQLKLIIAGIITILAISFIIGLFVHLWVNKPVRAIVEATKNVASGNLNYVIPNISQDELGILANSFNIMTQKLLEMRQQLFQSDKMASLGRLAAGVAHEINNPLTGVLTYSSYLLKKTQNNKELNEDLQVIVRETKRSRDIVKSLLDFGRQTMPQKRPADINEILENSLQVIKNQLQLLHIKVVRNYKKALPDIKIDANQIQQVLINLLVNAADAIGEKGGQIQIKTTLVSLSAHGVIQVKRAVCPKGHNLINNQSRIDGLPSLSLKFKEKNNSGQIQIDPVYGLHRDVISKNINNPAEVSFLCAKCETSLNSKDKKCPECSSNIYIIDVPDEGTIEGCCNPACNWQHWNLTDIDRVNDYIEIHIKDNGEGIPSQHVSHIFDPFYSTKGTKGTGLGLSVVWGIIDNHDGIIKVESEEKKGTEFIIRLPVK